MNSTKSKVINFRITELENKMLLELIDSINSNNAEDINRSRYLTMLVRNSIELTPSFLQPELKELKQTNIQLRSIGQNLNQITRAIHTGKAEAVNELTENFLKTMSAYIVQSRKEINLIVDHNQKRSQIEIEKVVKSNGN